MKPLLNAVLAIAIATLAWHCCASAQVEKKPEPPRLLSSGVSCYDEKTGILAGSKKLRTPVLVSSDGLYRAYAETEAAAFQTLSVNGADCENTSTLFVADPKTHGFRPVLILKPTRESPGNSIDLADWSPKGHRLLLTRGAWQWGTDSAEVTVQIYDAESANPPRTIPVVEAFSKLVGRNCAVVFQPAGFSRNGIPIVTAEPFFEEGEDQPDTESCVRKKGLWFVDSRAPSVTRLPGSYKIQHYGTPAP